MITAPIRAAAFAVIVFTALPTARGGDGVTLLGGVGSMMKADIEQVCCRLRRAYYSPVYVYSCPTPIAPTYEALPYPYPQPPNAYPTPSYQPTAPPLDPASFAPPAPLPPPALGRRPTIAVGFAGRRLIAAIVFSGNGIRVEAARAPATPPPGRSEQQLPLPRPDDSFRYDGGPANPVPMPDGSRPGPTIEPTPPAAVPALNRVKATPPKAGIAYPAFGEDLPRRPVTNPLLVRYPLPK